MTNLIVVTETNVVLVTAPDLTTELIVVGIAGPQGVPGTGGGGGDVTVFVFSQPTPSSTWTIDHNLGRAPVAVNVTLLDGSIVIPDRHDTDVNHTVLTFSSPAAGSAELI